MGFNRKRKANRLENYDYSQDGYYSTSPNTPQPFDRLRVLRRVLSEVEALAAGMKAKVEPYEAQTRNEVKFLSVVGLGIRLRRMNHPGLPLRYPVACYGEVHFVANCAKNKVEYFGRDLGWENDFGPIRANRARMLV